MATRPNNASTVYFAPEEIHRIRATVSSTLQHASQLKGTPRQPRDAASSTRDATAASLLADMAGSSQCRGRGDTLPILTVGQPYAPCTTPTADLRPMRLADLRVETHHRGRKLMLERAAGVGGKGLSAVVQLAGRSWALVQEVEGEGDVERLEVCLHTYQHGKDALECSGGKVLVVREPYFTVTEQGEATVRVDHPSDLEWLDGEKGSHASTIKDGLEDVESAAQGARRCKERGNTALAARDPSLACTHYTRGLLQLTALQPKESSRSRSARLEELTRDLHRNRAHANLLLNRLDAAKHDALSSLTGASAPGAEFLALDSKAYYRAGCAAYNLCEYEEARGFFSKRIQLTPEVGDAATGETGQRIRERDTGAYDLSRMRAAAALSRARGIDAASFVSRTQVGDSPGRGRGLFAACDVPAGDLVLCEKAFCVAWGDGRNASTAAVTYDVRDGRIRVSPVGLVRSVVGKLRGTPSHIERVLGLHGDYRGDGGPGRQEVHPDDSNPVVDVFRVHDIVSRNAFGLGPATRDAGRPEAEGRGVGISTGLWLRAARINHSCVPNTEKEFVGDMMLVRAKRRIAAGEEILHSYVDERSSYKTRKEALLATWGFECDCSLCEGQRGR
ncbi:putative tpr domain-containing protein [Diaporthe ampelina]|uniref:Putative tpr domain-containing protein n=1 Tax=Diaporthe ampelina TaxID=1214573 RepID=A0A0G2FAT3_9PEZI|nr:putative tpr domain-containing protein [Diaporthe ampelina]